MFNDYNWQRDHSKGLLKKNMTIILWENRTYIVEEFPVNEKMVTVLRINSDDKDAKMKMPTFISVGDEITGIFFI